MNPSFWLPLLVVASSFVPGVVIFTLRERSHRTRTALNLLGAVTKLVLIGIMLAEIYRIDAFFETRLPLLPGLDLVLHGSPLAMLFVTLSALLWLLTTLYAIGYL